MSEFSDSIHIFDKKIEDIERVLNLMNISAAILGSNNITVSVLMDWEDKTKIHNKFKLIDFSYAEEHGLWLNFYLQKKIATIEISWDDTEIIGYDTNTAPKPEITENYSKILFDNHFIAKNDMKKIEELINNFDKSNWQHRGEFVNKLGNLLSLFSFSWVSFNSLQYNLEEYKLDYPDLVLCSI